MTCPHFCDSACRNQKAPSGKRRMQAGPGMVGRPAWALRMAGIKGSTEVAQMSRPVHVASKSRDGEHTACTRHTAASAWGVTGPNSQRRKLNATRPEGPRLRKQPGYRAGGGGGHGPCRPDRPPAVWASGRSGEPQGGRLCPGEPGRGKLSQSFGKDFTDHRARVEPYPCYLLAV